MTRNYGLENIVKWMILLTILILPSPLIWMKIGPDGYALYGPDVPDVYILGATILGKDRSWIGINFAYKFQLLMIMVYLAVAVWAFIGIRKNLPSRIHLYFNMTLLVAFIVWLRLYVRGVVNNSDGADLTLYPHIGLLLYLMLFVLNLLAIIKYKTRSPATPRTR